jgi:hypothetical protein
LRFVGESLFIFTSPTPQTPNGFKSVYIYNVVTNELRNPLANTSAASSAGEPVEGASRVSGDGAGEDYLDVCAGALDQSEALVLVNSPPSLYALTSATRISYCDRVHLENHGIQKMGVKWFVFMFIVWI